jgi:hypothetical protein
MLPARDVEKALRYYVERLGFRHTFGKVSNNYVGDDRRGRRGCAARRALRWSPRFEQLRVRCPRMRTGGPRRLLARCHQARRGEPSQGGERCPARAQPRPGSRRPADRARAPPRRRRLARRRRRPRHGSSLARLVRSRQVRRRVPTDVLGHPARSRRVAARPRGSSRSTRPGYWPALGVAVLRPRPARAPGIHQRVDLVLGQLRLIPAQALAKHRFAELGELQRQAHPLGRCQFTLAQRQCSKEAGPQARSRFAPKRAALMLPRSDARRRIHTASADTIVSL